MRQFFFVQNRKGVCGLFEFEIQNMEDGILLDRAILKRYPDLPRNSIYKALRKRDIRVDGRRVSQNVPLSAGMKIVAYIAVPDAPSYKVVYENHWILLCEKPQGLLSEPDGREETSLLEMVHQIPGGEDYALCHRLDRNTGGLIFLCKKASFTQDISDCLAARYYAKVYRAVVLGDIRPLLPAGAHFTHFKAYHFKDQRNKRVYIYDKPRVGTKVIETAIRFVSYDGNRDVSTVEVQLLTGRTHQIRAHLAFLGHPVAGDGKYGVETRNRLLGYRYQALWAYCYKPTDDYQGARRIQNVAIEDILPATVFTSVPKFI